ncbi:MAG: AAA family ATPase [Micromonosporaceae bacterium]
MRPLRLALDGFGSYRQLADIDLSDVDFFALTGPTGSGKSTVIDGLCFALYGTVPRWGKENVIAHALAPSANSCRVCLVFEAAGMRYAAVRALTRDKRGVHTKEARLERLDASVPPGAPLAQILEASADKIAEGPDQVAAGVQKLLGLSYEHFTQSVLLPQGRFAEFLQATPGQRQELLVELLAFGVYKQIGQRARERAQRAADLRQLAQHARDELADATADAEATAAEEVGALASLADAAQERLERLAAVREEAAQAAERAAAARTESARLAALRIPAGVPGLTERIYAADARLAECRKHREDAEHLEADAMRARAELPDKNAMERFRNAYAGQRTLAAALERQEATLAGCAAKEDSLAEQAEACERELEQAREALAAADQAHAAAALAEHLRAGEPCPVCLQPVTALPHHAAPPAWSRAKSRADEAAKRFKQARDAHLVAGAETAAARSAAEATRQRLADIAGDLAGAPAEADVAAALDTIAAADAEFDQARRQVHVRRKEAAAAGEARAALADGERRAWAALRESRDKLVEFGAPPADGPDLAAAWETLAGWAAAQRADRDARQPELDAAAGALKQRASDDGAALLALMAAHGITAVADPSQAPVRIAQRRAQAEERLAGLRRARKQAAKLDRQIGAYRDEEQVAGMLGNLLRANTFERWLCTEALDSLVTEASATLMELSGGQYQLDRDDRSELVVIDYNDAGARRPVHTLSGGETFQASLALALALSHQVIALSAGVRDLNSMFLDEGFGTLDEDTLDTVASTLEQLAAGKDRMVGIVTHVAALADRVPVRFVVSREGATSVLTKDHA